MGTVEIKEIDSFTIEILGKRYVSEDFVQSQLLSKYIEGLRKGTTTHIAEVKMINEREK